jgi:hypothetical protein
MSPSCGASSVEDPQMVLRQQAAEAHRASGTQGPIGRGGHTLPPYVPFESTAIRARGVGRGRGGAGCRVVEAQRPSSGPGHRRDPRQQVRCRADGPGCLPYTNTPVSALCQTNGARPQSRSPKGPNPETASSSPGGTTGGYVREPGAVPGRVLQRGWANEAPMGPRTLPEEVASLLGLRLPFSLLLPPERPRDR